MDGPLTSTDSSMFASSNKNIKINVKVTTRNDEVYTLVIAVVIYE